MGLICVDYMSGGGVRKVEKYFCRLLRSTYVENYAIGEGRGVVGEAEVESLHE